MISWEPARQRSVAAGRGPNVTLSTVNLSTHPPHQFSEQSLQNREKPALLLFGRQAAARFTLAAKSLEPPSFRRQPERLGKTHSPPAALFQNRNGPTPWWDNRSTRSVHFASGWGNSPFPIPSRLRSFTRSFISPPRRARHLSPSPRHGGRSRHVVHPPTRSPRVPPGTMSNSAALEAPMSRSWEVQPPDRKRI